MTFQMAGVNTGQGSQAMLLNRMMITIIGRWHCSGWRVLDSLEKVRLQLLCSASTLSCHITFIERCSKICLNKSIAFSVPIET